MSWLLAALVASQLAAAQGPAGSLSGAVRDAASHQPVAYATVVLLPAGPVGAALAGATADEQGRFRLANLAAGDFRLRVSVLGYAPRTLPVRVGAGPSTVATVLLVPTAQQLAEALVVGRKPLVEVGLDRLVYHANQDVGTAGGTAADVLRKTPLLAVDGQGNVTLRGSASFQVLVNGKPAPTLAQNLPQALRTIPADQILRVEVMPTPSARYDGEGTAGIVNIVLQKGLGRGRTARFGASGGNRAGELTAAFGAQAGKLGLTAAASAGSWYEPDRLTRYRLGYGGAAPDTLRQSGERQTTGRWYNGSLGADYNPAAYHRVSLAGSLSGYQATAQQDLLNQFLSPVATKNQLFTRATASPVSSLSTEATGTYTRTFAQARREWSVLGQYARTAGAAGYDFDQFNNSAVALAHDRADYRERSRSRTPGRELTLQSDFTQPFGIKNSLEMGVKAIFRRTSAVAEVDTLLPALGASLARAPRRSTNFDYAQAVQAAYASYAVAVGTQLTASLGGRMERTTLAAGFGGPGGGMLGRRYVLLLPTGTVRYTFRDTSAVRLAYGRRISRPAIDYLNPYVDRSNSQNIAYGNPALDPELTDTYEVGYNTIYKAVTLVVSGAVRHTGNAVEQVRLPAGTAGVTATTFANVAATTVYQFTGYGTAHPLPRWEVSGGPTVQYVVRRSPALDVVRHGLTASMRVDTSYQFRRKLTAQASVAAALPTPTLQGRGAANLDYSLSVKQVLLHDQAEVSLNLTDPFTGSVPYRSTTATAFFDERTEYRAFQRAFRLSVSYRLGQELPERSRKQVTNDDRK